jgi:carotenoid cleavage dioxygenase-like enzyme
MFLLTILSTLRLIPVSQGVANTALVHYADQTLALYETDSPYLLDVDFDKKKVSTIRKLKVPGINNFSGHTKKVGNLLETIDYDIFKREAIIYTLDKEMKIVQRIPVKTKYIPIVHDFIATEKYTIFIDSPLHIELDKILKKSMPVSLKRGKPTYIHVVNKHTNEIETFELLDSIYAFHLTNLKETQDKYTFDSLQLDKLDFSDIKFHPKLRKIVLNKNSKKVFNQKFENLEELDMDFPLKIDKTRTLFNLIGPNGFYGFAICKFSRIIKKIILDDTTINGEPQIIQWKEEPHVIAFIKEKESNSLFVMNLNDYTYTTTNIPLEITQGFHSIFIPKK